MVHTEIKNGTFIHSYVVSNFPYFPYMKMNLSSAPLYQRHIVKVNRIGDSGIAYQVMSLLLTCIAIIMKIKWECSAIYTVHSISVFTCHKTYFRIKFLDFHISIQANTILKINYTVYYCPTMTILPEKNKTKNT